MISAAFITGDLPFASYLHATRKLRFIACELNGAGRIAFVFEDPNGEGEQLHIQFESGAECPAAVFYDSVRHLRRVMTRTQNKGAAHNDNYYNH